MTQAEFSRINISGTSLIILKIMINNNRMLITIRNIHAAQLITIECQLSYRIFPS